MPTYNGLLPALKTIPYVSLSPQHEVGKAFVAYAMLTLFPMRCGFGYVSANERSAPNRHDGAIGGGRLSFHKSSATSLQPYVCVQMNWQAAIFIVEIKEKGSLECN